MLQDVQLAGVEEAQPHVTIEAAGGTNVPIGVGIVVEGAAGRGEARGWVGSGQVECSCLFQVRFGPRADLLMRPPSSKGEVSCTYLDTSLVATFARRGGLRSSCLFTTVMFPMARSFIP